jgi:eukaryotic-like serine/threonine-protein kinase
VHRDIKPQNLMLTAAGEVKLLDFGIAMVLTEGSDKKPTAKERALRGFAIFGTPEYMAPEQVAGEDIDGRTDVYALGCVLYEMLTGTRAFEGSSSVVVMGKQLRETPRPPRAVADTRGIPRELDAIVMRAMKKSPGDRFPTAQALSVALEEMIVAPTRRRAAVRRFVSRAAVVVAMLGAALGAAHWARTDARVVDAALVLPPPAPAPVPVPVVVQSPAPLATAATAAAAAPAPTPNVPLRDARAAARARSDDPKALENWTRAALRAGELREARRAAAAWTLHDGTVEPRLVSAEILDASGRHTEARTVLQEWLESHPDSSDARDALAHLTGEMAPREIARR